MPETSYQQMIVAGETFEALSWNDTGKLIRKISEQVHQAKV
jgi:hypothetical protein